MNYITTWQLMPLLILGVFCLFIVAYKVSELDDRIKKLEQDTRGEAG